MPAGHGTIQLIKNLPALNSSAKNEDLLKMSSPQVIRDVDEFVSSSDLEKCVIPLLAHKWMLCREWVPSE